MMHSHQSIVSTLSWFKSWKFIGNFNLANSLEILLIWPVKSVNSLAFILQEHESQRKLSWKFSLLKSHQLSSSNFWPEQQSWENSHTNSYIQLPSTLIWPGHESWENSHTNSRLSTLINSHATLVLVWPGHGNWENSHTNSRLSTLINSHVTLVVVWPGHESWENSHTNSCFSTLMDPNFFSFVHNVRVDKNSDTNSRLLNLIDSRATLVLVWLEHENSQNLSCKPSLLNSHPRLTRHLVVFLTKCLIVQILTCWM